MLLADDGESVSLGVTTLQPDIEVSADVDADLSDGVARQLRINDLVKEYSSTMEPEAMRKWAADLVSTLAARR